MTLKIYTKTGDTGSTGLFGGGRVGKDHPRVEAYGDVDELNAALGLARSSSAIDACDRELEPLKSFILPGGTPKAAALHVARTICRRAERRVVALQREVELPPLVVIYLNRLSDLLFTLARLANQRAGAGEVTW